MDKRPVKNKKKRHEGFVAKKQSVQSFRRIGIVRLKQLDGQDDLHIHLVNVDLSSKDRLFGCRGCDECVDFEGSFECEARQKSTPIDESIDVDPAVHLRLVSRPTMSRLCVVNSRVYVFDGYTEFTFDESDSKFNAKDKWISRYELTEEILGGVNNKVGESDLTKACEMNYPKYCPTAVPTPNGKKILVFSGFFSPYLKGCFELYDIDSEKCKCELLPPIPQVYSENEGHFPAAYSFLSDTRFFLETNTSIHSINFNARYIFDLERWKWELLGSTGIPWDAHRMGFEVVDGRYILNLFLVHHLPGLFLKQQRGVVEKWEEVPTNQRSTFTLSSKPWGRLLGKDMMVVDFNREDQVCHFCTLLAYPLDDNTHDKAQVFIDLIRIYLPTSNRPALNSTLVQSLRVVIKGRVGKDAFDDLGLDFSLCCL